MGERIDRERAREPWHLLTLRVLVYVGAALVFSTPLTDRSGLIASALGAGMGVVAAALLARWRWPWVVLGGAGLLLAGVKAGAILGGSTRLARSLGPGATLVLIECASFGAVMLGLALVLRTLTRRWRACAFIEVALIVAGVAYSFRSHRLYPFSQPQALSDWAFLQGYDPRYVLMAIGLATLVGLGFLLFPRQGPVRTALAAALLILFAWLILPRLFGRVAAVAEAAREVRVRAEPARPELVKAVPKVPVPAIPSVPEQARQVAVQTKAVETRNQKLPARRLTPERKPRRKTVAKRQPPPPNRRKEPPPTLTLSDVRLDEGNAGQTAFVFHAELSRAADTRVSVNYRTTGGTAKPGTDYAPVEGTLTIPAGQTKAAVTVNVTGDTEQEPDETFFVALANPVNAELKHDTAVGFIRNDDHEPDAPVLSVEDVRVQEGDAGTTPAVFPFTLSAPAAKAVKVRFATVKQTAAPGEDFEPVEGTLTIPAGETKAAVSVNVIGDTRVERDETFLLQLSKPEGATLERTSAVGTIVNDDEEATPPTIDIADARVEEGTDIPSTMTFVVSLTPPPTRNVEVHYETVPGTATPNRPGQGGGGTTPFGTVVDVLTRPPGTAPVPAPEKKGPAADYLPVSGVLTFPAGVWRKSIEVEVIGDHEIEPDETFQVKLSKPVNGKLGRDTATGLIINDDHDPPPPDLSIDDVKHEEGNAGKTPFVFTVSLSAKHTKPVEVHYATTGDPVKSDDYVPTHGKLTIPPGETKATITVDVLGDTTFEPDETFGVQLRDPVNAYIARELGIGTIVNDDTESPPPQDPTLEIDDVVVDEGNAGHTPAQFHITLSMPADRPVRVNYATATDTALAGEDFVPAQGTVTLAPGQTKVAVTVNVVGDTVIEPDERFFVRLSNPVNAAVGRDQGVGTIVNDDKPALSIADASIVEGDQGTTPAEFAVTLSAPSPSEVSVHYKTANGTAEAGKDFHPADNVLTIPRGQTRARITVGVIGETRVESDETFTVTLSEPKNATIDRGKAQGTITNDDRPKLSIDDVTVAEGNQGATPAQFTVTLSDTSATDVRVRYETIQGTARPGIDFQPSQGELRIPAGETKARVSVLVTGNTKIEPDKTFTVKLSNPENATLARESGTGTIANDDKPKVSIDDVTHEEGDSGTTPFVFHVRLSEPAFQEIKLPYITRARTANFDEDFRPNEGTLAVPPGRQEATITIAVVGDTVVEPDETFDVLLKATDSAVLVRDLGVGTIVNDDREPPPPKVSLADAAVDEGNAGTTPAAFRVTLSHATTREVTLHYQTAAGTATPNADFQPADGDLNVPAGQTEATITVGVVGDTEVEPDKTFAVKLSNPSGAIIERGEATGTIRNDDKEPPPPELSIDDVKHEEGNAGKTPFTFTVRASAPATVEIAVHYATGGGTADPAQDYTRSEGTLTIPRGRSAATFTVDVTGDTLHEPDETFLVQLSAPRNATLKRDQATATIVNDDKAPDDSPDDDEFDWEQTGPPPLKPAALVKFHDDDDPIEQGYYLRTFAYSKLAGTRMLRDEAADADVAWDVSDDRLNLPARPPSDVLRDLTCTVYLIGPQDTVMGLVQPVSFASQKNPMPQEFSGVFRVGSQVLTYPVRNGEAIETFEALATRNGGDSRWDEATRKHYFAYPDDARYRELARQIGNTLDSRRRASPVARMLATRKWMQEHLTYDYNPDHADAADPTASFLFGDQRGYCVHLAHAMAVLLRAQGVPARIAVGYRVSPERRGQRGSMMVYESDAHAWAEIYVEGVGWIVAEAATKGRIPPPDPEPDPREHDRYLSLIGDIPPEVFASDEGSLAIAARWVRRGIPLSLLLTLLALYAIKFRRMLWPGDSDPARLHRVGYRAVLDRLAQAGMRRRYGETWDDFALRVEARIPGFCRVTEMHLRGSFGHGGPVDRAEWKRWEADVLREITATVPAKRRLLGWLNPVSWMGVG